MQSLLIIRFVVLSMYVSACNFVCECEEQVEITGYKRRQENKLFQHQVHLDRHFGQARCLCHATVLPPLFVLLLLFLLYLQVFLQSIITSTAGTSAISLLQYSSQIPLLATSTTRELNTQTHPPLALATHG